MFAVKGWNLTADKLQTETASASASKKRKRPDGEDTKISASQIGGLWEKVIEHKEPKGRDRSGGKSRKEKRQKSNNASAQIFDAAVATTSPGKKAKQGESVKAGSKQKDAGAARVAQTDDATEGEWGGIEDGPSRETSGGQKSRKDSKPKAGDKKDKKAKKGQQSNETAKPPPPPVPASTVKLTPLQAAMREKLVSARFRHLNETLYTRPSADAFGLFRDSPEMFTEYHEGFRRQVEVWPENPVVGYIADIQARAKQRFPPKQRTPDAVMPLPRTKSTCTIADLGCGDAALAAALQKVKGKLGLDVKSFDLQTGGSDLITRADIANLPLREGSVDVAIFCLALMGTNWIDFIEEAYRVLRWKGELWVAEIKSRFAQPGKRKVVEHSVGNRRKAAPTPAPAPPAPTKKAKKDAAAGEEATNETDLAIEVDGAEDKRQETDVSAFIDVLEKRGFVLRGEPGESIELDNKMFVKMYFVKGAPATRGKCVDATRLAMATAKSKPKMKFITRDEEDGMSPEKEAGVLKPCVYKLR